MDEQNNTTLQELRDEHERAMLARVEQLLREEPHPKTVFRHGDDFFVLYEGKKHE